MDNKLEMELEELDSMLRLLKENNKDQLMLVGQVNYITETYLSVDVSVSTNVDYNGSEIIVSWKEEVGREMLPENDQDVAKVEKMKILEERIKSKKKEIYERLKSEGYAVAYGIWK